MPEPRWDPSAVDWLTEACKRFDQQVSDLAWQRAVDEGRDVITVKDMKEAADTIIESDPDWIDRPRRRG